MELTEDFLISWLSDLLSFLCLLCGKILTSSGSVPSPLCPLWQKS